jgi:hypothetical protein
VITATIETLRTGRTARCFKDFSYTTLPELRPMPFDSPRGRLSHYPSRTVVSGLMRRLGLPEILMTAE